MVSVAKDTLLTQIAAFRSALDSAPPGESVERARYHTDRLEQAVRASHNEGIRFAAYTIGHTLSTRSDRFPATIAEAFGALRAALAEAGHPF